MKSTNWKFFDNTKDLLAFIVSEYGSEALFARKYLSDHTSPMLPQGQKNLVKQAYDCGIVKILQNNMDSDQKQKLDAVKKATKKLIDLMYSHEIAERVVWEFTNALGWGNTAPQNDNPVQTQPQPIPAPPPTVPIPGLDSLMMRAWLFAEDGDWQEATDYFNKILDIDPKYAPAYLGLLCADLKVAKEEELANIKNAVVILGHKQYKRATADPEIKARLDGYVQTIKDGLEKALTVLRERFDPKKSELQKPKNEGEYYKNPDKIRVHLDGIDWLALDELNGKVLLISEKVLERKEYHVGGSAITWEQCTLRKYLNGEFLDKLDTINSIIIEIQNDNPDNPWYQTVGGNQTKDKIFLLSLNEVCRYFGDSSAKLNKMGSTGSDCYIEDQNNKNRIAEDESGTVSWWWLRSPGGGIDFGSGTSCVDMDGCVRVASYVYNDTRSGGVRPAFWIKLY